MLELKINGASPRRCCARHAPAVGPAGPSGPDGHQVRLRHGAVRRLHRAHRRPAGALLRDPRGGAAGKAITTIEGLDGRGRQAPCSRPGKRSTCPSAATASRARSCRPPRCSRKSRSPTTPQIDAAMNGNICRCGTYRRIRAAISDAVPEPGGLNHGTPRIPQAVADRRPGALVSACYLPEPRVRPPASGGRSHANAWLRIDPDNRITFICPGTRWARTCTPLSPMLVAEELGVPVASLVIEQAPAARVQQRACSAASSPAGPPRSATPGCRCARRGRRGAPCCSWPRPRTLAGGCDDAQGRDGHVTGRAASGSSYGALAGTRQACRRRPPKRWR